jgi:cell wall-associated NlpC family hydrolase
VRRALLLVILLLACSVASLHAAPKPKPSWAQAEITLVVARGLMGPDVPSFRPDDPITQAELAALLAGLTGRPVLQPLSPASPVTIAGLDALLVQALGLQDAAATFARSARAAGLATPSRFGTEVVARLLGLRKNHPAAVDQLERLPGDPASRAEAAYSAARILRFRGGEQEYARDAAAAFVLPALGTWQRRLLGSAFSFVGYPYVWGGESELPLGAGPYGAQPQGGFDCSGLVWRVYKFQRYPEAGALAATLRGRTTYAMSAEVPRTSRIPLEQLAPADLVFFGSRGPKSKPKEVDHMGIYVGGGWMFHSSRHGVALVPLTGHYRTRFAWARRPLVEAGLEGEPVRFTR